MLSAVVCVFFESHCKMAFRKPRSGFGRDHFCVYRATQLYPRVRKIHQLDMKSLQVTERLDTQSVFQALIWTKGLSSCCIFLFSSFWKQHGSVFNAFREATEFGRLCFGILEQTVGELDERIQDVQESLRKAKQENQMCVILESIPNVENKRSAEFK